MRRLGHPGFFAAAALAAGMAAALAPVRGADDSVLRRDRGIVTYAVGGATPRSLEGSVSVGDAVIASTGGSSLAALQLADSSEIRIGGLSTVRVGDLRAAAGANPSGGTIFVRRGAVRFSIVHPGGAKANFRFVTPTTQLAVRGTVGYFVAGPTGDQIYCVTCDAGDVEITTAGRTVSIQTGQTLNVAISRGQVTGTAVVANRTINNPAIDQFLDGVSPFGEPASAGRDFTSSRSGP